MLDRAVGIARSQNTAHSEVSGEMIMLYLTSTELAQNANLGSQHADGSARGRQH
jgi:hypothetical protein